MTQSFILTGPESSGKSTLASLMASYWSAPLVEEQARSYLGEKQQQNSEFRYGQEDLLHIAQLQWQAEQAALDLKPERLICDTDLLVLMVWSEDKFGNCDTWIRDHFELGLQQANRHYILCDWQIPWQEDPLRENPDDRGRLFRLYQQKMKEYGIAYTAVGGSTVQRFKQVYAASLAGA